MKKYKKIITTLALIVFAMVAAIVLGATGQMAGWVVQTVVAVAAFHLFFILGWGAAKNGWGYRV